MEGDGECSEQLTLTYGKHHTSLVTEIRQWFDEETCADVRLACQGGIALLAHSLVLASASPLLRRLLEDVARVPEVTVTVHMPDVLPVHMKITLDYLYTGQASLQVHNTIRQLTFKLFTGGYLLYNQTTNKISYCRNQSHALILAFNIKRVKRGPPPHYIWHALSLLSVLTFYCTTIHNAINTLYSMRPTSGITIRTELNRVSD